MLDELDGYDIDVYNAHLVIGHRFDHFLYIVLHLERYIRTTDFAVDFDINVGVYRIAYDIATHASAANGFHADISSAAKRIVSRNTLCPYVTSLENVLFRFAHIYRLHLAGSISVSIIP